MFSIQKQKYLRLDCIRNFSGSDEDLGAEALSVEDPSRDHRPDVSTLANLFSVL